MVRKEFSFTNLITKNRNLESALNFTMFLCLKIFRHYFQLIPKKNINIIIVTLHKLGDSVFTFSAIEEIKKRHKENIYILCFPDSKPIYELIHPSELIITIPKKYFYFHERIANTKARKILKNLHPKIIFDLTGVMTSASLIFNSSAKVIIGMNRKIFKGLYNTYSSVEIFKHSSDIYLNAIKCEIQKEQNNKQKIKIEFDKKGLILIHPFAGWRSKEWNLTKFIKLGLFLSRNYNCAIISEPNQINQDIKSSFLNLGLALIETPNIKEMISCIKSSSCVIGNDSGIIQIAAFLGKPTFAIYGPTNPDFHNPDGLFHWTIQNQISCSPQKDERICFTNAGRNGCPSFECLNSLSYNNVRDMIIGLIKRLDLVSKNY